MFDDSSEARFESSISELYEFACLDVACEILTRFKQSASAFGIQVGSFSPIRARKHGFHLWRRTVGGRGLEISRANTQAGNVNAQHDQAKKSSVRLLVKTLCGK